VHSFFLARKVHYNLYIAVPALILTLAANALLIPSYGIFGAVLAILVVEVASTLLAIALTKGAIKLPIPIPEITRIGLATAAMGAAMLSISGEGTATALLLKLIFASIAFVSVAIALNIENCRDKAIPLTRRLSAKAFPLSR
jgi:O-antigen/teichoic acid export membrane protein